MNTNQKIVEPTLTPESPPVLPIAVPSLPPVEQGTLLGTHDLHSSMISTDCIEGAHCKIPDPTPSTTNMFVSGVGNFAGLENKKKHQDKMREWVPEGNPKEGHPNLNTKTTQDPNREKNSLNQRPQKLQTNALTERDRDLLVLILEQQFVVGEHVETFFRQGGVNDKSVWTRRVRKLLEAGVLSAMKYPELGRVSVLRLTARGLAQASEHRGRYLSYKRDLNPMTLKHDLLVTSLRLSLAVLWDGRFVPERAIKDHGLELIPDGLWVFPSGRFFAIELENSDKGPKRFLRLAERWQSVNAPNLLGVLYFASNALVLRALERSFERIPPKPPMGLINYQALIASQRTEGTLPLAQTQRGDLALFSRRSF